jgi:hypothetical protein
MWNKARKKNTRGFNREAAFGGSQRTPTASERRPQIERKEVRSLKMPRSLQILIASDAAF